jgi:agmatine deiminase
VNTDGHVDNVAVFGPDHQIIVQMSEQENPNYSRLAENLDVIRSSRCADGKEMTVETIDSLPYATMPNGKLQPAPYVNFALTGKTIVIPSVGASSDGQVGQLMMDIFPGRVARFVPSYALTYGGGGPHCITMQWPA